MTSPMQRDKILQDEIDLGFIDGLLPEFRDRASGRSLATG